MMVTVQVGRPENLKLIEKFADGKGQFVATFSHVEMETPGPQPIHQVGVFARIHAIKDGIGNARMVTLEGLGRVALLAVVGQQPYLSATVSPLETPPLESRLIRGRIDEVMNIVGEIAHLDPMYSPEISNVLRLDMDTPSLFADRVASMFHFSLGAKQEILETVKLETRFDVLLGHLNQELSRAATILSINENAKKRIEDEQRRYFLRQQLHEIRKELGEELVEEREATRLRAFVKNSPNLPPDVSARARIEIDRLGQLSPASAEYSMTKSYLDWLLNMPWGKTTSDDYDIKEAQTIIDEQYYGPTTLKEQILQRLTVRKIMRGVDDGGTLCLVGAPGTGKASLAKAIAKAMGKEFARISVGGISDVAEIKGTSRTFLGAYPGKIVRTLRELGTTDPLILIEDIDYFNIDNDSSVNMALLEVIDSRKNPRFMDQYIGVPFDLSKVFFICSVRSYEELPEQFVPRLEIIEVPGYIEKEKIEIAKKYIIPEMLKKHELTRREFRISDAMLAKIISSYTQEAGLLGFSQQMDRIFRRIALQKAEKAKAVWVINEKNIDSFLGTPPFIPEKAETKPEIGNAAGLAWTGAGGELMFIEGIKMKGDGQIITTGSLGEVMRESIQAAHSYVRSKADMLGIDPDDFRQFDIHIHFPSGAIPKDGPSAGITVCLVIASVMSERPIRNDMAMTGEVTLRGKVLPVGGTKEKVSAAYRAGIFTVVLPKENEKDVKDLPKEIVKKTKFHFIERVDELFRLCLLDVTPSTHTLQKIFSDELARVRRKRRNGRRTPAKAAQPKRRR